MSLDQIGVRAGTDKSSTHHGYLAFYEAFLAPFRERAPRILEIGILDGASLRTWADYFEYSPIFAVDLDPSTRRFAGDRVTVEILDQSNIDDLTRLGVKHGPFDIVIEDGSHMWEHQITTLRTLFPFVREGGIYIVEDLQTNFGRQTPYRGVSSISCVEYLKRAVDLRVADSAVNIAAEEDAFLRTYARSMDLSFHKGCCLIRKQYEQTVQAAAFPGEPIVPVEQYGNAIAVSIVAHIGTTGNVFGERGSVRAVSPRQNIQGFTLHPSADLHDALEYRARLDDGSWTGWVGSGTFAGTKGQSRDLTGFSVRLSDAVAPAATVQAIGLFRGDANPVLTGADEDCVPAKGLAVLHGMQVILQRSGWA